MLEYSFEGSPSSASKNIYLILWVTCTQDRDAKKTTVQLEATMYKPDSQSMALSADTVFRYGTSSSNYTEKRVKSPGGLNSVAGGDFTAWTIGSCSYTVSHDEFGNAPDQYVYVRSNSSTKIGSATIGTLTVEGTFSIDSLRQPGKADLYFDRDEFTLAILIEDTGWNLVYKVHSEDLLFPDYIIDSNYFDTGLAEAIELDKAQHFIKFPSKKSKNFYVDVQAYTDNTLTEAVGNTKYYYYTVEARQEDGPIVDASKIRIAVYENEDFVYDRNIVQNYTNWLFVYTYWENGRSETVYDGQYWAIVKTITVRRGNMSWSDRDYIVENDYGRITYDIDFTDSRGITTTIQQTVDVVKYTEPTISDVRIFRCNRDGYPNDDGESASVTCKYTFCDPSMKDYSRVSINDDVNTTKNITSGETTLFHNLSTTRSYTIVIECRDKKGEAAVFRYTLPTSFATFNALPGGHGFSFGKMAEKFEVLDSAWDIRTEKNLVIGDTSLSEQELIDLKEGKEDSEPPSELVIGNTRITEADIINLKNMLENPPSSTSGFGVIQNNEEITFTAKDDEMFFNGYVTNGKKKIILAIPFAKSLERVYAVTVNEFKANIANNGGYCITSAFVSGGSNYMSSSFSSYISLPSNTLFLILTRTTAMTVNNNDNVQCRPTKIRLTFSAYDDDDEQPLSLE